MEDIDAGARAQQFRACAPEVLEWVETEAQKNFARRVESEKQLSAQAHQTMTLLLAGVGGGTALALPALSAGWSATTVAAAALAAYFALCAGALVASAMWIRAAPVGHNSPKNLMQSGVTLHHIRCGQLVNLQQDIEDQTAINAQRARWLNGVRLAAALSPLVALAALLAPLR